VPRLQPPYPTAVHPEVAAVEQATHAWLASHGVGASPREAAIIAGGGFAHLTARAYYRAATEVLQIATDFATWAFLFDDTCERPDGDRAAIDRLCAGVIALCEGHGWDGAEPLLHAFADLRTRVADTLGAASAGFLADVARFVRAVQDQLVLATARPSFEAELRTRELTIGLYPCLHLIGPAGAAERAAARRRDPHHAARDRLVAEALCWTNDLISLRKELAAGESHNLVLAIQWQRGCPLQAAVDEAVGRYYRTLTEFAELDARCRGEDAASRAYSNGLRDWIAALPAWSYASDRYAV